MKYWDLSLTQSYIVDYEFNIVYYCVRIQNVKIFLCIKELNFNSWIFLIWFSLFVVVFKTRWIEAVNSKF